VRGCAGESPGASAGVVSASGLHVGVAEAGAPGAGNGKSSERGGWIGTAKRPTDLTSDEDAGSLKNIIVLARKRPIQEGIIEKLDFSRLFGNYVTGQIEADFLDLDGDYEDIATSDRQRLIEDDPRVLALQSFLRDRFLEASDRWTEERPKKKAQSALERYPKLQEWVDGLPDYMRMPAEKMIGTVAGLEFDGTHDEQQKQRVDLFRSGILDSSASACARA
jgi:hypothetical protein